MGHVRSTMITIIMFAETVGGSGIQNNGYIT